MENLWKNWYHQASLLILASLLPRLPKYEDLKSQVMYRLPGIKVGGPNMSPPWVISTVSWGARGANSIICCAPGASAHKRPDSLGSSWAWRRWPWSWTTGPRQVRYYDEQAVKPGPRIRASLTCSCNARWPRRILARP